MARANKYASVNFNHVYEKNISSSSSSNNTNNHPSKHQSSSTSFYSTISSPNSPNNLYKSHLPSSSTRTHGRMLVLTRPTPKPISTVQTPPLTPSPKTPPAHPAQVQIPARTGFEPESDRISLRPLGRTGVGSIVSSPVRGQETQKEVGFTVGSPKPDKFVPPHLRPGFVGREERPGPEVFRGKEAGQRQQQQQQQFFGSTGRFGGDGRPKSGGYETMRRGDESNLGFVRPSSSGNRPSSSGCPCNLVAPFSYTILMGSMLFVCYPFCNFSSLMYFKNLCSVASHSLFLPAFVHLKAIMANIYITNFICTPENRSCLKVY
ncbi:hypothetical protein SADUNF_Sadunf13G0058800 [Salix dunnii]|uniref:Uncharacterized protein n=1 Tax=Salix dunnii TaxID=1413687 RepID=A0A835JJ36_9ROSI|nr:hypothetical protein SADUNF_Sadunf13G0058800 [Salix dunnii]